jgi:hypothetical protein
VLAGDGVIYCAPHHRHSVLCIDARNSKANNGVYVSESKQTFEAEGGAGPGASTLLSSKWFGAVYVPAAPLSEKDDDATNGGEDKKNKKPAGGAVYFTPFNASRVLKFDVSTQQGMLVGGDEDCNAPSSPSSSTGAASSAGGSASSSSSSSSSLLMSSGGEKYMGACYSRGFVVACPANRGGRKVLVLDPRTDTVVLAGPDLGGEHYKWHDTVTGADGLAYGVPHHAGKVKGVRGVLVLRRLVTYF